MNCNTIIEKNRIVHRKIILKHLARTDNMIITVGQERWVPESFDCFGNPIFSKKQYEVYKLMSKLVYEKNLEVVVIYEQVEFNQPKELYNTLEHIKTFCSELEHLNNLINYRKIHSVIHPKEMLNEFVIFSKYLLKRCGQIEVIVNHTQIDKSNAKVETYETFRKNSIPGFKTILNKYCIPKSNDKCSCCGKTFTIYDVKEKFCILEDHEYYHEECYEKYKELKTLLRKK